MTSQRGGEPVGPPVFPSVGGDAGRAPESPTTIYTPPPAPEPAPEPIPQPSPVQPTQSSGRGGGGGGRTRWLIAGIATIVVIALLGSLVVFLGARPATPSLVAQYAPADAAAYVELRYDLPGDQAANLAEFMSHFPGFADQAAFQQKLDETLANMVGRTDTGLDWATDIKPWFGGQLGAFSSSLEPTAGTPPSFTFAMSVADKAKLDEFVSAHVAEAPDLESETYSGQTIWSGNVEDLENRISFSATNEALVVSSRLEDLKAALDIKAGTTQGLADDQFFLDQLGAMDADRLGLVYSNYGSLLESGLGTGPGSALPGAGIPEGCLDGLQSISGVRAMAEVRAEGDHLSFRTRSEFPSGTDLPPAPGNRNAGLTSVMPGNTVAYAEMHQVGANVGFLIGQLLDCIPAVSEGMAFDPAQIEQILGVPLDEYFDFLVDAGFAVTIDGDEFGAGFVATVDDEAVANSRVATLLAFLRLAGGTGSDGITVTDEQHGNATIHVITIPALSEIFAEPADTPTSISVSVAGGRLYIGVADFVTKAMDQQAGDSLAAEQHLQEAINEVGASNTGMVFVDLDGVWSFVESKMAGETRSQYETEGKPFVDPLSDFVVVTRNDNGINDGHAFLYVE